MSVSLLNTIKNRWNQIVQWLLHGSQAVSQHNAADFAVDAQWAISQQQARGARLLLWASLVVVVVLLQVLSLVD